MASWGNNRGRDFFWNILNQTLQKTNVASKTLSVLISKELISNLIRDYDVKYFRWSMNL